MDSSIKSVEKEPEGASPSGNLTSADLEERLKDDPDAIYRIYSIISYFVVLVVIGLPVWWFTTRVYRAPLPLEEMLDYDISHKIIRENSIPLSLEYDVLITILNPNPSNLSVQLDTKILKTNLEPFLETVSSIANFTVKSQWLYLTELGVTPKMVGNKFIIYEEQLPLIVTPLETKIWSHLSPRPTLNLVTYISRCDTPLYISSETDELVASNAFLNPRWGGISIVNADEKSCIQGLFKPDISNIVWIYITQLQELIGLKDSKEKDIEDLARTKSFDMISSTRRTLKSLALLLSEISSIVISDEVALKIQMALENVNKADDYLEKNDLNTALRYSKLAYYNSEKAFSDPSLLALLYFPDDQK